MKHLCTSPRKTLLSLGLTLICANSWAKDPPKNSYLASDKYAITHFDPSQSDAMPYPIKEGTYYVKVEDSPRITSGPVNIMTFASTDSKYMWAVSSQGATYIDISNGGLRKVTSINAPGVKQVTERSIRQLLQTELTTEDQVQNMVSKDLGLDWTRITNGIYSLVDQNNRLFYNTGDQKVFVFGLNDPKKPELGLKVIASKDFSNVIGGKGHMMAGLSLTYDGRLIVVGDQSVSVIDRDLLNEPVTFKLNPDERITNSIAVDEDNGIYVASDKNMRKLVWKDQRLSADEKDGAWIAAYDSGREPNSVKVGTGTGSTPTLMGFGSDKDKLVVITDGADRMKLVAFWRDEIPKDFKQVAGAKTRRIAGQIAVTAGLSPAPEFIQTEQSVVVKDYGAFVVNNVRKQGAKDRLVDVLAGGPIFEPPKGMERFEWNTDDHMWKSVWTRNDVSSLSMVPAVSIPSNIVVVNGYDQRQGWNVVGMDWDTGKTVHQINFGQSSFGNGAYAILQYASNGDLLFNSIGGVSRIPYVTVKMKQAEEAEDKD